MHQKVTVDLGISMGAAALVTLAGGVWIAGRSVPPIQAVLIGAVVLLVLAAIAVRRPVLAPAAVAVLLVAGDVQLPFGVALVYVLALAAVVIVVTARLGGRGRPIGRSPLITVMAVLVGVALLSTLWSVDPGLSARHNVGHVVGVLLAAAVVMATANRSDLLLLGVALCIGGAFLSATALTSIPNLQAETSDAALVVNRPVGVFTQPNQLGLCAAMTFCFGIAMIVVVRRRGRSWLTALCGVAVILALAALAVSLSRGAWIGTAVGLVVLAVLLREARTALLCLATTAAMGLTLLVVAAPSQPDTPIVAQRLLSIFGGPGNPYDERPAARAEAVVQMSERPILGSGPGAYPVAAQQGLPHIAAARENEHAHSLVLTVGAEEGVVGAAALVAAIGVGVGSALSVRRAPPVGASGGTPRGAVRTDLTAADLTTRGVCAGSSAALAAVIGHGVVDYPLAHPVVATMTWLSIGLLAACRRTWSDTPPHLFRGGT